MRYNILSIGDVIVKINNIKVNNINNYEYIKEIPKK